MFYLPRTQNKTVVLNYLRKCLQYFIYQNILNDNLVPDICTIILVYTLMISLHILPNIAPHLVVFKVIPTGQEPYMQTSEATESSFLCRTLNIFFDTGGYKDIYTYPWPLSYYFSLWCSFLAHRNINVKFNRIT